MTELLIKKFIKDYKDVKDPVVREAYGKLGSTVGIIANIILCLSKIAVGTLFGSVAIMADGINNLSDAGSSAITFIGFILSGKPADEDHPFGHARIEYIAGFIVAMIIILLGVELVKTSFQRILNPKEPNFSVLMVIVLIFSILSKFWMSCFNKNLGDKISSIAMKATATDSMNDVIATSAVLISIVVTQVAGWQLDGYMGVVVALFIIYSGINIMKDIVNPLLGELPDAEFIETIEKKILSYEGVINIHDLVIHNYGPTKYFATVHAEVDASEDILKSHDMIDNIERDTSIDLDVNLVIHLDPVIINDKEMDDLRCVVNEIVKSIGDRLTIHDFRIVRGETHTNLIFDVVVPANFNMSNKELVALIDNMIKKQDTKYYTVITVDKNYVATYAHKPDEK